VALILGRIKRKRKEKYIFRNKKKMLAPDREKSLRKEKENKIYKLPMEGRWIWEID
jgi:hypothetical protein